MKTFLKVLKITGLVFLALFVVLCISVIRDFKKGAEHVASYDAYSPPCHRNTKWVCQEEDIFFTSDSDGCMRGQVRVNGACKPFSITIRYRTDGVQVGRPSKGGSYSLFGGRASYSEGMFVLTYQGEKDEEKYFGDKTGEVTLTFVEEPLSEEELGRPWICQECDAYFYLDTGRLIWGKVASSEGEKEFLLRVGNGSFRIYRDKENFPGNLSELFKGKASYSEGVYVLTYQGEDDVEHFFGDRTGEVTLTFVEETGTAEG